MVFNAFQTWHYACPCVKYVRAKATWEKSDALGTNILPSIVPPTWLFGVRQLLRGGWTILWLCSIAVFFDIFDLKKKNIFLILICTKNCTFFTVPGIISCTCRGPINSCQFGQKTTFINEGNLLDLILLVKCVIKIFVKGCSGQKTRVGQHITWGH